MDIVNLAAQNTINQVSTAIDRTTILLAQQGVEEERLKAELENAKKNARKPVSFDHGDTFKDQEIEFLASKASLLELKLKEKDDLIKEKDDLILEWMHHDEAFKRLARNYRKKLGKSDEEVQLDFENSIIEVAEENPKFNNTRLLNNIKNKVKI